MPPVTSLRCGSAAIYALVSVVIAVALSALALSMTNDPRPLDAGDASGGVPLVIHCSPDLQPALVEIGTAYERLTGTRVAVTAHDSDQLVASLGTGSRVDLVALPPAAVAVASSQLAEQLPMVAGDQALTLAITTSSERPTRALHLARYITAPDYGAATLRSRGFTAPGLDRWADVPELILYSGMVNRPAIQAAVDEFAAREGVRVTTKWNGCGVLTADMRDIVERVNDGADLRVPDAYYTCDGAYLGPVTDLFGQAQVMSETDVVIAVPAGNPAGITSLSDLAKADVRLGVSHAQQSTLGWLTLHLLQTEGLLEQVRGNIVVENPQADFLMNHLRAGHLDAVIVYAVSVMAHPEGIEVVSVDSPAAKAVQTFSVGATSPYPALAERLRQAMHTNRDRYEAVGLRWRDEAPRTSQAFVVPGGPGSDG